MAVLLLKKLGVRMDLAENGSVALEHLMARPYDLVADALPHARNERVRGRRGSASPGGPNRDVPIVAVTADVAAGRVSVPSIPA